MLRNGEGQIGDLGLDAAADKRTARLQHQRLDAPRRFDLDWWAVSGA